MFGSYDCPSLTRMYLSYTSLHSLSTRLSHANCAPKTKDGMNDDLLSACKDKTNPTVGSAMHLQYVVQ